MFGFGEQPQDVARLMMHYWCIGIAVRCCAPVKQSHPVQISETCSARVSIGIIGQAQLCDESDGRTWEFMWLLCGVAFENGRCALGAQATRWQRSRLAFRASVSDNTLTVLCKIRAVWPDVTVSHRRAHRQCSAEANQRRADAMDVRPTCETTTNSVTTMT
eukprot:6601420-Prymnesium_polylepis.1